MYSTIKGKLKFRVTVMTLLILILCAIFFLKPVVYGAYISNSMINRYVYDLSQETTYDAFTEYKLEIEEKIGTADLYLNPIFSYNYENHEGELDLNLGYLDIYFNNFDLRLGKQKVTWGKADGLVVTNVVNPRNLTEYPAVEFEDQFQSINAVKLNYYFGSNPLEMIWIPKFKPMKVDKQVFQNNLADSLGLSRPVIDNSKKDIETRFDNSEFALKYSVLDSNYDYELVAAYLWDDQPTLHLDNRLVDGKLSRVVIPQYHRRPMVGGSFSTATGPYVVRGEAAYTGGKYYNTTDFIHHRDGTVMKDQFKWLLGLDYYLGKYLLSGQFMQEAILDYEDSIKQDQHANTATFSIQRSFWRDTLDTELTFYYDMAQGDLIAKPRVSYDYSDKINFEVGADNALDGGLRNDVIYLQTEYLF